MKRFAVVSDIHLEFYKVPKYGFLPHIIKQSSETDTLVIAGDLGYPLNSKGKPNHAFMNFLALMKSKFPHVIYVPGNHEYYQCLEFCHSVDEIDALLRELCMKLGIVFLQCGSWIHPCGLKLLGCTLWSDITHEAVSQMNDFNRIFVTKIEYNTLHNEHVKWLEKELEESKQPTVVVTHHLPTYKAIHEQYAGQPTNSAFASHLDRLFCGPVVTWIAGHTHEAIDIGVNERRLYVNPIGYPQEKRVTHYDSTPIDILF